MNDTTSQGRAAAASSYGPKRPKVPAFARYKGTSAWRRDRRRVRAYELFRAAEQAKATKTESTPAL